MKKQTALTIGLAAGGVSIVAWFLAVSGHLPIPAAELITIVAFPVFIIFIALWWSAKSGDEDTPFIGY